MDYASDIDEFGLPIRRKRRGGGSMSFMVIAMGTVFMAAAWIMTTSDPYADLAHRVLEVRAEPGSVEVEPVPLFEIPDAVLAEATGEAVIQREILPAPVEPAVSIAPPSVARSAGGEVDVLAWSAEGEFGTQAAPVDPLAMIGPILPTGEAGEAFLGLDRDRRREIQRRLAMGGFDAGAPDGLFGPATRDAIRSYQASEGIAATGFLDQATLTSLVARTDADYAAWNAQHSAGRKVKRQDRARLRYTVPNSPMPASRDRKTAGGCARDADGHVLGNRSFGCDLRGLGEGLAKALRGDLKPADEPRLEPRAGANR